MNPLILSENDCIDKCTLGTYPEFKGKKEKPEGVLNFVSVSSLTIKRSETKSPEGHLYR